MTAVRIGEVAPAAAPPAPPAPRGPRERRRLSIFVIGFTILLLLPLAVVILASVNPGAYLTFPPNGFSGRWFAAALEYPRFRTSLILSLQIAAVVAVCGLVITVPAAVAIVRGGPRTKDLLRVSTVLPLVTPDMLLALGLLIMLSQLAMASSSLGLVLGHVLIGMPIAAQVLVAGLASVDENLEQAAQTLGASPLVAFVRVTIPAILPAIGSAAVFLFIFSFDNVSISLFLSSPGKTTLPITMFQYLEYNADPTAAAMSTILIVLSLVVALVLGRLGGLRHITGSATGRAR